MDLITEVLGSVVAYHALFFFKSEAMPLDYVSQPALPNEKVFVFLRTHGMRLAEWPQILLPEHVTRAYTTQVLESAKVLNGFAKNIEMKSSVNEALLAEAKLPQALLKTRWGALIARFSDSGNDFPLILQLEVHCERAWQHPKLECIQDRFLFLIDSAIDQVKELHVEAPLASNADLYLNPSSTGALGEVCIKVPFNADEKEKLEAGHKLALFLVSVLESAKFKRLLKQSFED